MARQRFIKPGGTFSFSQPTLEGVISSYDKQSMRRAQFERVRRIHKNMIESTMYYTDRAILTLTNKKKLTVFFTD